MNTTPRMHLLTSSNETLRRAEQKFPANEIPGSWILDCDVAGSLLLGSSMELACWIEQSFGARGGFVRPSGQTLPLSVTFLSPAVSCSVRAFMTVADGDTLALIMPVRAECCSTTGPACPSSASLVPPAPINTHQPGVTTSLLYSGSQFRGYQKSKGNSYDVEVVLQVMLFSHCVTGHSSIFFLIDVTNLSDVSSVFFVLVVIHSSHNRLTSFWSRPGDSF